MNHSPSIDLYNYPSKNSRLDMPPSPPSTVRGWLMGVPGYRESSPDKHKNEQIPQEQPQKQTMIGTSINSISNGENMARRKSISSIASEDSVNLDDLIKANYTLDMDDETDLPNLSGLDLDDSNEDFWKLDKSLPEYQSLLKQTPKEGYCDTSHSDATKESLSYVDGMNNTEQQEYNIYIKNCHLDSPELTWSPPDDHLETRSPSANSSYNNNINNNIITNSATRARSGSINSDNSLNSYSTVTASQYSRYGMAPMIYQSDSTSTSSRTASRLSNYSASSQASSNTASTGLPRPRKISSSSTGMSSPSRSFNSREESHLLPRAHSKLGTSHLPTTNEGSSSTTNGRSRLAQRASHIPSPSSTNTVNNNNMTSLPRLTSIPSSKSTGIPGGRSVSRFGEREGTGGSRATTTTTIGGSTTSRKLASRASHIPSLHERSSSPGLGLGKSSAHSTIRNSVFGSRRDDDSTSPQTTRRGPSTSSSHLRSPNQQRQGVTPQSGKSTGLRPPTDTRSASRIGLRKA